MRGLRLLQVLTEIQRARCTVEAHPYMVDVFGVTDAIAAEVCILRVE